MNLSVLGGWPSLVFHIPWDTLNPDTVNLENLKWWHHHTLKSSKQSICGKPTSASKKYFLICHGNFPHKLGKHMYKLIQIYYWEFGPGAGLQLTIFCSQVSIVQHHNNSTSIEKMLLQSFLVDHENWISHVTWMISLNTLFSKGPDAHVTIHHCKVQQQLSVTYL